MLYTNYMSVGGEAGGEEDYQVLVKRLMNKPEMAHLYMCVYIQNMYFKLIRTHT